MDPRVRVRRRVAVRVRIVPLAEWVATENAKGHLCACGCGKPIRVLPQHRARGIPRYLLAHNPRAMEKEVLALREAGLLTATDVAQALGIGATTLRRLEGKLFEPVPRQGKRAMRVFTAEQVEALRKALREKTRLGTESELLSLEDVALRAGCDVLTIRRRRGKELPAGRQVAHPRRMWGFTPEETKQIVAWVKRHRRGRQGRRPGR